MLRFALAVLILLICTIMMIPVMVVLFVARIWDPHGIARITQEILKIMSRMLLWATGSNIEVKGLENVPQDTPCLFVANHRSVFDIVVFYGYINRETAFVAKKETKKIPLISQFMTLMNGMFLDRADLRQGMQIILRAISLVGEGACVCIFPEGTRNKNGSVGEMLPFHAGSFKVATKSKAPIVPVVLEGTREIFEDHLPLVKKSNVRMIVGEPIYTDKLEENERRHIADYTREIMLRMI